MKIAKLDRSFIEKSSFHEALQIYRRLKAAGHTCYFAGGCVRDWLLGRNNDDIDLASSATPGEVMELFDKVIPLGQRYGSVAVVIQNAERAKTFEITTFRQDGHYSDGRHPDQITPSDPMTDAQRRDFTVNGLFYDPDEEIVIDYVEGLRDLKNGILRAIGEPKQRFLEDRLRMLRAVRFSCRLGFEIDAATKKAIEELAVDLYPKVSIERVWQEWAKMEKEHTLAQGLHQFLQLGLLQSLIPSLQQDRQSFRIVQDVSKAKLPLFLTICTLILFSSACSVDDLLAFVKAKQAENIGRFWKQPRKNLALAQKIQAFIEYWIHDPKVCKEPHSWSALLACSIENPSFDQWIKLFFLYYGNNLDSWENWNQWKQKYKLPLQRILEGKKLIDPQVLISLGYAPGPRLGEILHKVRQLEFSKPDITAQQALNEILNKKL